MLHLRALRLHVFTVIPLFSLLVDAIRPSAHLSRGARKGWRLSYSAGPSFAELSGPPLSLDLSLPADSAHGTRRAAPSRRVPAGGEVSKPRLFFLFMVYEKINNEDIWAKFSAPAKPGVDYKAFVHCKDAAKCSKTIKAKNIFEIIPSVGTVYCHDLVGAMNALLSFALEKSAADGADSSLDKFAFVSDSTLPVKPFIDVRQRLISQDGSDFCIFPRNLWFEVTENFGGNQASMRKVAVRHHQWIVLSRRHAEEAVRAGRANKVPDLMQQFQVNVANKNSGCADEFWHFAVLFQTLDLIGTSMVLPLSDFVGGPLTTDNYEIQGRCDTFVHWSARARGVNNSMTRLADAMSTDPGTNMHLDSNFRPASINRFSMTSLKKLRDSPFLFVRKVEDNCAFSGCGTFAGAFDSYVFAAEEQNKAPAAWAGEGDWLDNRRAPVTITSHDGALRLVGKDASMRALGSYCGSRIEMVFESDYRATAELSADMQRLLWNNGVSWDRVER